MRKLRRRLRRNLSALKGERFIDTSRMDCYPTSRLVVTRIAAIALLIMTVMCTFAFHAYLHADGDVERDASAVLVVRAASVVLAMIVIDQCAYVIWYISRLLKGRRRQTLLE